MGAMRMYHHAAGKAPVSRSGGGGRSSTDHPLLDLQRAAGNQAVTAWVQREKSYHSSKVAAAPMEMLYQGKCDADPKGAAVRRKWSRGLFGKDVSIIFECGPRSFEFSAYHPYVGKHFPWDIETVGGDGAFVTQPVADGLEDIDDDMDDAGSKFWGGYHVIRDLLADDLKAFCADQG